MNKMYFIIGAFVVMAVIVVVYYKRYEIEKFVKSESFKNLVHELMVKAESIYHSGEGKSKFDYVVSTAIKYLPVAIQPSAKKFVGLLVDELFELYKTTRYDDEGNEHNVVV